MGIFSKIHAYVLLKTRREFIHLRRLLMQKQGIIKRKLSTLFQANRFCLSNHKNYHLNKFFQTKTKLYLCLL